MNKLNVEETILNDKSITLKNYSYQKLSVIYTAIEEGLCYSELLNKSLSYSQMLEVLFGLRDGVDVTFYSRGQKSELLMRKIRLLLKKFGDKKLEHYRDLITLNNVDFIDKVLSSNKSEFLLIYPLNQYDIKHLIKGFELFKLGLNVNDFMSIDNSDNINLDEFSKAYYNNKDLWFLYTPTFSPSQKNELLKTVNENLSIDLISDPLLSPMEMRQYRICLANGMNIESMVKDKLQPSEIKRERLSFINGIEANDKIDFDKLINYSKLIPKTTPNIF